MSELTKQEAEDIINVMLRERGLADVKFVYNARETFADERWRGRIVKVKKRKFLWWTWKTKTLGQNFGKGRTIYDLLKDCEASLEYLLSREYEQSKQAVRIAKDIADMRKAHDARVRALATQQLHKILEK